MSYSDVVFFKTASVNDPDEEIAVIRISSIHPSQGVGGSLRCLRVETGRVSLVCSK